MKQLHFREWILKSPFKNVSGELHFVAYCLWSKKGKGVLLHAMEALGGRGGTAPTHSQPRH
jgi:hypothetical protein